MTEKALERLNDIICIALIEISNGKKNFDFVKVDTWQFVLEKAREIKRIEIDYADK